MTSHISCSIPGIVFRETVKSNSKSPKFIPEAKYLKKKSKNLIFFSSKEADEEVESYPGQLCEVP